MLQSRFAAFLRRTAALPVSVDPIQPGTAFNRILSVARQNELTEYDAAYPELALREALPLATLDNKLRRTATRVGMTLVMP